MNTLKRAIVIVGIVAVVVILALLAITLYALNKKNENAERIAPATKNRWAAKPKDEAVNNVPEMVASPGSNGPDNSHASNGSELGQSPIHTSS